MKKAILAMAAAAALAVGTLSVPTAADARCHGCGLGVGIAAGIIGGAIIGGAIANSHPRGDYVEYEGYDRAYPYRCHRGYWARKRLYNRDDEFVGWSRPHFVCSERY